MSAHIEHQHDSIAITFFKDDSNVVCDRKCTKAYQPTDERVVAERRLLRIFSEHPNHKTNLFLNPDRELSIPSFKPSMKLDDHASF